MPGTQIQSTSEVLQHFKIKTFFGGVPVFLAQMQKTSKQYS